MDSIFNGAKKIKFTKISDIKRDFPINDTYPQKRKRHIPKEIAQVVWEQYDKDGHGSQSLEKIGERGGFGWYEITFYLYSRILELTDVEKIADFMHDQWSHWMKHLFSKTLKCNDIPIPADSWTTYDGELIEWEEVEHWKRQMNTPYSKLSEKEKDSDREWARKLLGLIQ